MNRAIGTVFILLLELSAVRAEQIPDCTPGIFELSSRELGPDGRYTHTRATSVEHCGLFDSKLRVAEYRALDLTGEVVFRGLSLALPSEDGSVEQLLWAMIGDPGYTTPSGRMINGILTHGGFGTDATGDYEERSKTRRLPDGSYHFKMDRRYGEAAGWLEDYNVIEATRISTDPGPLPARLSVEHPAARSSGTWVHMGRVQQEGDQYQPRHVLERRQVVLDGLAVISLRQHLGRHDEPLGTTYTFETMHAGHWRVLEWTPGGPVVEQHLESRGDKVVSRVDLSTITEERFGASRHRLISGASGLEEEWWLHRAEQRPYGKDVPVHQCDGYEFLLGDFRMDAAAMQADQSLMNGVGFVSGQRLLDGRMLSAEMHVLFMDGSGFRGTTLRSRDDAGRWHVTWVAEGVPTSSSGLSADNEDGCVEVFQGTDVHGAHSGHLILHGHNADGFEVTMDRRYPGGPTIPKIWSYSARRVPRTEAKGGKAVPTTGSPAD